MGWDQADYLQKRTITESARVEPITRGNHPERGRAAHCVAAASISPLLRTSGAEIRGKSKPDVRNVR
jgi:hypothetical protein